jgi:hypothetical protein
MRSFERLFEQQGGSCGNGDGGMREHTSDHTETHTGDHTATFNRRRGSGTLLSLVPDLVPDLDAGVSARPCHRPARPCHRPTRRVVGPRPVRPSGVRSGPVPGCGAVSRTGRARPERGPGGRERVLVRSPRRHSEPLAWRFRVRRAAAVVVAVVVAAVVVVGLGLLADAASATRDAPAGHERTVTVGSLTSVAPAPERGGPVH